MNGSTIAEYSPPCSSTPQNLNACSLVFGLSLSVADPQAIINEALGTSLPIDDLNGDGVVTVADVQIENRAVF